MSTYTVHIKRYILYRPIVANLKFLIKKKNYITAQLSSAECNYKAWKYNSDYLQKMPRMIYWATFGVLFSLIYLFIITAIRWFRFILSKWSKLFQIIYLELLYYILCKINTILLQKWFMYYLQSLNWIESNDMVIWWPSENPYRLITNLKHVLITYYYYKHRNVLVFFISIFTFECTVGQKSI